MPWYAERTVTTSFRAAALALLLLACGTGATEPSLTRVVPSSGTAEGAIDVVIEGERLQRRSVVDAVSGDVLMNDAYGAWLAGVALEQVSWRSSTELGARVPPGLAVGAHDLRVVDALGRELTLAGAFTVVDGASSTGAGTGGAGGAEATGAGGAGAWGGGGGAGVCDYDPCKLTKPQCGCDPGMQCSIDMAEQILCVAAPASPKAFGEACADDCGEGLQCDLGPTDYCRAFCYSNADCVAFGPGSKCIWKFMTGGTAYACTLDCNLLDGSGCPDATRCAPFLDSADPSNVGTDCAIGGSQIESQPCANSDQCASGLLCAGSSCHRYCDLGAPVCPGVQSCQPFTNPAVIAGVSYGYCF